MPVVRRVEHARSIRGAARARRRPGGTRRAAGSCRTPRRGARNALEHRLRGVRPRAGRRPRPGLGDTDRRRTGHRQVDAAPAMRGGARPGPGRPVRDRRGIRAPGGRTRAPARLGRRQPQAGRRDGRRAHRRTRGRGGRGSARHRLDPDHDRGRRRVRTRGRDAAARVDGEPRAPRKGERHCRAPDRPRDARGRHRGPARARAHGRHGALLRERPRAAASG